MILSNKISQSYSKWATFRSRLAALVRDPAWYIPVAIFIVLRVSLSIWMWAVRQIWPLNLPPHPILRPYVGVAVETNAWLEPWQRWDTLHYQAIAERGYEAFDTALFVPPLYPFLMRYTSQLFGNRTLLAGILIANLTFLGSLLVFYRLVQTETGSGILARRSVLYYASFPAAFFLMAAYTEPIFVLMAMLCLYQARRRKWVQAGIWGALGALTRLPGVVLIVPLAYEAWRAYREEGTRQGSEAIMIAAGGALFFPIYVTGWMGLPPWQPLVVQSMRFQGGLSWPGANMVEVIRRFIGGQFYVADLLDFVLISIFIGCAFYVWNWLPKAYGVYYLTLLGLYLVRFSELQPLLGTSRYVLALFPAFIVLSRFGQDPWVNRIILYLSWAGLLFMAGQFAIWGWVG